MTTAQPVIFKCALWDTACSIHQAKAIFKRILTISSTSNWLFQLRQKECPLMQSQEFSNSTCIFGTMQKNTILLVCFSSSRTRPHSPEPLLELKHLWLSLFFQALCRLNPVHLLKVLQKQQTIWIAICLGGKQSQRYSVFWSQINRMSVNTKCE